MQRDIYDFFLSNTDHEIEVHSLPSYFPGRDGEWVRLKGYGPHAFRSFPALCSCARELTSVPLPLRQQQIAEGGQGQAAADGRLLPVVGAPHPLRQHGVLVTALARVHLNQAQRALLRHHSRHVRAHRLTRTKLCLQRGRSLSDSTVCPLQLESYRKQHRLRGLRGRGVQVGRKAAPVSQARSQEDPPILSTPRRRVRCCSCALHPLVFACL